MADTLTSQAEAESETDPKPEASPGPFTACGYTFGEHASSGVPVHYLSVLLKYFLPYDYIYDQSLKQTIESQFAENLLELKYGLNSEAASAHVTGSRAEGLAIPEYILRKSNDANTPDDRTDIISFVNQFETEETIEESLESDLSEEATTKSSKPTRGSILEPLSCPELPKNCIRAKLTSDVVDALKLHNVSDLESSLHELFLLAGEKHLRSLKSLQRLLVNLRAGTLDVTQEGDSRSVSESGMMYGIALSGWPEIAAQWAARSRTSGWPHEHYIQQITEKGVHILPLADSTDNKNTWIYSFFLAETTLAQLLSKDQRKCFVILKLLYEHYFNETDTFSPFHLKTFFLWICEFIPAVDFRDTHLGCTLLTILETLSDVLQKRQLDHYFIDGINLLSDMSPDRSQSMAQRIRWVMENIYECILKMDTQISFSNVLGDREKLSIAFASMAHTCTESPMDVDGFIASASEGLLEILRSYMEICKHIPSLQSPTDERVAWNVMMDLFREILVDMREFEEVPESMNNMDYMLGCLVSVKKDPETLAQLYMYLCIRADLKDKSKMISVLRGVLNRSGDIILLKGKGYILESMLAILGQLPVPENTTTSNQALYMQRYKDVLLDEMLGSMTLS